MQTLPPLPPNDTRTHKVCLTVYSLTINLLFGWAVFKNGANPWWLAFAAVLVSMFGHALRRV